MPVKSPAQFRLMQAAAHGASYGPSKNVAKEMLDKTPHKTKSAFAGVGRKKKLHVGK